MFQKNPSKKPNKLKNQKLKLKEPQKRPKRKRKMLLLVFLIQKKHQKIKRLVKLRILPSKQKTFKFNYQNLNLKQMSLKLIFLEQEHK